MVFFLTVMWNTACFCTTSTYLSDMCRYFLNLNTIIMDYGKVFNTPLTLALAPDDWENIPASIPSTLQFLQSEIYSVVQVLKNVVHADRMAERKFDCVEEIDILKMKLAKNAAEVAKAVGEVRSLGNIQEDLWNEHNKLQRESEKTMDYIKTATSATIGKNEEKADRQYKNPTLWSINGLKKLITDTLNESEVRRLIEVREFDLMHLDEEIEQIVKFNQKLIANVNHEVENLHEKIMENTRLREEYHTQLREEQKKLKEKIFDTWGETENIRKTARELKADFDKTMQKIDAFSSETQANLVSTNTRIDKTVTKIKKRKTEIGNFATVEKETGNAIESLKARIEKQDSILELFKDVVEQQGRMKQLETSMNLTKAELKKLVSETLENIKTDSKETKTEVYKKLDENDKEIKSLLQKMDSVTNSLEEWALKVIKPAQSNEVKIFTLESRLREEEDQRMAESGKNKNYLKKIIYALEQYGLGLVDKENAEMHDKTDIKSDHTLSENEFDEQLVLPPVAQRRVTPQRKTKRIFETSLLIDTNQRKTKEFSDPEMMLLKRLHHIKRAIEGQASQTAIYFAKAIQLADREKERSYHRPKRRVRLHHKEVPDLVVEAKKAVQETRKKNGASKEREDTVAAGFDYRSERQKYGTFKNYIATVHGNTREESSLVFYLFLRNFLICIIGAEQCINDGGQGSIIDGHYYYYCYLCSLPFYV
eukprot:TRINITY_DN88047_c0_g1_i1.p1 TRINITY_DN88047_c0_g1~~TRINITY_DN88047_c0_g1_i1.p1  ORF type:complete len:710 (+),score=109.84 TRINITY_DN88047_c0_g1_i1:600-2729(+)